MKGIRGFSLIELMTTIAVLGVMMAIGLPSLMSWIAASRTNAMPEFYLDGLRRARDGAIKHNAAARLVLTTNAANGQSNWQIDWCAPISTTACTDASGVWSTTGSAVSTTAGQPPGPSIFRSADGLPSSAIVTPTTNGGETEIYFTSTGWLNTSVQNIRQLTFTPASTDILPVQISITLSGIAERCNPTIAAPDSRACP